MSNRIFAATLVVLAFVVPGARADDTTWTRTFFTGQASLPARVRCSGTDVYVAGSATQPSTMSAYLLKYDVNGDLEWFLDIEFYLYNLAVGLAVGPDSNPVIGLDIGYTAARAALIKVSSSGDTLWTRTWDLAAVEALAIDQNNNVYVAGTRGASIQDSLWIAKLTGDGAMVWSRTYRLAGAHTVNGAGVNSAGELYVPMLLIESAEWPEVAKFSSAGDTLWRKKYGGVTRHFGIAVEPAGSFFLVSNSSAKKLNGDGSQQWSASVPSGTLGQDAAIDDAGNGYVCFNDNSQDFKVRRYAAANGAVQWTKRCVLPTQDLPLSVAADAQRQAVVAGMGIDGSVMRNLTVRFTSSPGVAEPEEPGRAPDGWIALHQDVGPVRRLSGTVPGAGTYRLRVYDGTGRTVVRDRAVNLESGPFCIPLPALAGGVYFASLCGPAGSGSGRFVVID